MLQDDGKTPKSSNVYSLENNNGCNHDFFIMPQSSNDMYEDDDNYRFHARVPSNRISIAITGDMAFYATVFGKPNMD